MTGIFIIRNLSKIAGSRVNLAAYNGIIYPYMSYSVVWGSESVLTKFVFPYSEKSDENNISTYFLQSYFKVI